MCIAIVSGSYGRHDACSIRDRSEGDGGGNRVREVFSLGGICISCRKPTSKAGDDSFRLPLRLDWGLKNELGLCPVGAAAKIDVLKALRAKSAVVECTGLN